MVRLSAFGLPVALMLSTALCMSAAAACLADGMMIAARPEIPAMEAGQRAIIIDEGATESILFQVTYRGARDNFAWVLPVPGRPVPGGVDQGSQFFLDSVEALTSPAVYTEPPPRLGLHGMALGGSAPTGVAASAMLGMRAGGPSPPTVLELERLSVGPYQVSVLAATGKGVLGGWLRDHGYRMPPEADADLDNYVGRGWYFLATRVQPGQPSPQVAGQTSMWQGDLPPLAVRFPRPPKLVYPLAISRAGVAGSCVLDLVILAPKPVDCDEAPVVKLPAGRAGHGSLWRLLDVASRGGKASVLLASLQGLPLHADASFMLNHRKPASVSWQGLWATRLWLRPNKERMVDLHFTPADFAPGTVPSRLEIHRRPPVSLGTVITGLLLLLLLGGGLWITIANRRACCGINLLALLGCMGLAWAGFASYSRFEAYDMAASELTSAINRFHEITGAFPARMSDLTSTRPPATALDASGNEVPLAARHGWRPLLGKLPRDPGAWWGGSWIVDLAAPGYVSSKAFRLTLRWRQVRAEVGGRPSPESESYGRPARSSAHHKVVPAPSVTLAHGVLGLTTAIWRSGNGRSVEAVPTGGLSAAAAGPGGDSLLGLELAYPLPGQPTGEWSAPSVEEGTGKVTSLATEPCPGEPLAICALGEGATALAATSLLAPQPQDAERPGAPSLSRPRGSSPPSEANFSRVRCPIFLLRPGLAPHQVAQVYGLCGLADAGDGKHALVLRHRQPAADGSPSAVMSLLDLATGKLTDLPGVGDVTGGVFGDWLASRDGYVFFITRSADLRTWSLRRRSPNGKIDTILTAPRLPEFDSQEHTVPMVVAPGAHGEALVIVPSDLPNDRDRLAVKRVGGASLHVVAYLHLSDPDRADEHFAVAWPDVDGADALLTAKTSPSSRRFVAVVHPEQPRLVLVPNEAATGLSYPTGGGPVKVLLSGTSPPAELMAVPRGVMQVTEAKSGWLAAVGSGGLSCRGTTVLGITRVEQHGWVRYLVGDRTYDAPSATAPPELSAALDGFALVYEPLDEAKP